MLDDSERPSFDPAAVNEWLETLHSDCSGYVNIAYVDMQGKFRHGSTFHVGERDQAILYARDLDKRGAQGVYVRVSTLREIPKLGERGGEAATLHLPALWADIDLDVIGHKHTTCPAGCKKAHQHKLPLPPDVTSAMAIVEQSGLPEPSAWQHSGGGLYPWWLLNEPYVCDGDIDALAEAQRVADHIELAIAQTARKLGWHYGTGISNLDRVLRLPGTVNRKANHERQSEMLPALDMPRYDWAELSGAILDIGLVATTHPSPTRPVSPRPPRVVGSGELRPLDAFAEAVTPADLLEPLGWTYVGGRYPSEKWLRPNASSSSEYSAKWMPDGMTPVLVVHSTEAGLPCGAGQRLTLGRLLAHLHFNGSEEQATAALLAAAGGNPDAHPAVASLPADVLDHVRTSCGVHAYQPPAPPREPPADLVIDPEEDPWREEAEKEDDDSFFDDAIELSALLAEPDEPYEWLVPGLLERQDRLIITGMEGGGKSTALRQFGVQMAAGIHPFTLEEINPLRVLLVDLENSKRQTKRKMRALHIAAGKQYMPDPGFHISCRPEGIDLLQESDRNNLWKLLTIHRPDVFIIGPIYKLASGDPNEEQTARIVATWIDSARKEFASAIILEAHSAKGAPGKPRPMDPYGASLWRRWPEFGIYIGTSSAGTGAKLTHGRGPRDEREWPSRLERGGTWPWTVRPECRPHALAHSTMKVQPR
jgi:hypothetical protein